MRERSFLRRAGGGLALALTLAAPPSIAQPVQPAQSPSVQADAPLPAPGSDGIVDLETMVVSGAVPGPGLWQVRRGEHVLWLLGTLGPLPKRMEWESAEVERVVSRSQAVLESPSVGLEKEVGLLRGLSMLPTALKARRDPDGRTLDEVVGAADHARWLALKARYIGRDAGIERWRPVFAALELYEKAVEKSGMTFDAGITRTVERAAKKAGVAVVPVKVTIPVDDPRAALKAFAREPLDDLACFRKTLDRIEGDLGNMAARANAWAVGDIEALRALPYENQFVACNAAFTGAALAKRYGIDDLQLRIERAWMAAAEDALARNASTFASMPIQQLLRGDGYLAKLRARGYDVVAPDQDDAEEAPQPGAADAAR